MPALPFQGSLSGQKPARTQDLPLDLFDHCDGRRMDSRATQKLLSELASTDQAFMEIHPEGSKVQTNFVD